MLYVGCSKRRPLGRRGQGCFAEDVARMYGNEEARKALAGMGVTKR